MTLLFIRLFFLIIGTVVGYYVGDVFLAPIMGLQIGFVCTLVLILLEGRMARVSVRGLSSMVFGLVLGVIMAKLLSDILTLLPLEQEILSVSKVVLTLIFAYLGAVMALRGKDEFNIIVPYMRFKRVDYHEDAILLDTSAIIDGRVSDLYKLNFLSGRLIVPRFVLKELQTLADSSDEMKRKKGRRGLDLLRQMQDDKEVDIYIHEDSLEKADGVDAKLVTLARMMDASICTTDYNLGQMATLRGVKVLNVYELSNAVKTVIFTGDEMSLPLIKKGKENGQAVGYTDDGTMIVVNNAQEKIGSTVDVKVASVLQTQGGKIVFANLV